MDPTCRGWYKWSNESIMKWKGANYILSRAEQVHMIHNDMKVWSIAH